MAAAIWVCALAPTIAPMIAASRAAGQLYSEAVGRRSAKGKLGPPRLRVARAGYQCSVEAESNQKVGGEALE
eukprot:5908552-Pyramimonas_sp.AAC.1